MQSASAAPDPEALATQGQAGDSIRALGAVLTPVEVLAATPAPVEETMTGGTGPTLIASNQGWEISD